MPSHIHTAHALWRAHLKPRDTAIDATCGNGHDALVLAPLVGTLLCIDKQPEAIEATKKRLGPLPHVSYQLGSHAELPAISPQLIVYNLGYLPGGDKSITTKTESTLVSIRRALEILAPGGMISITCYPGHPEGARETEQVECFIKDHLYTAHTKSNNAAAPRLYTVRKDN